MQPLAQKRRGKIIKVSGSFTFISFQDYCSSVFVSGNSISDKFVSVIDYSLYDLSLLDLFCSCFLSKGNEKLVNDKNNL